MKESGIQKESTSQFEKRKKDHIQWSLDPRAQAGSLRDFDRVQLIHEALPQIDFQDVSTRTVFLNHELSAPLMISSMTAGHTHSVKINQELASLSARKKILMGVGSQRRELSDPEAAAEWKRIRQHAPQALLLGNIGITQLVHTPVAEIQKLVDHLEGIGLFVHLNPLQECLQQEGTPQFRGALEALETVIRQITVPVIVKEVGCGFSPETLTRLEGIGVAAVDVSGSGGTHWGRVESLRFDDDQLEREIGESFANWGISTVESLTSYEPKTYRLWASGGVRNGVEVAKLLACGADMVGLAVPWLQAAMSGENVSESLDRLYEKLQRELKIALFCTGCATIKDIQTKKVWKWRNNF